MELRVQVSGYRLQRAKVRGVYSRAMDEMLEKNRRHWDELVALHQGTAYYDVPGFKAGRDSLHSLEVDELGDVSGQTLLHLQCHFGMDTISWARRGAIVTGVDFSPVAIETARKLAQEVGIEARFVQSDVYSLPDNLPGEFDIVYTSYGVLSWLPDVSLWAQIVAHFLRPGGTFYVAEFHPTSGVFVPAPEGEGIVPKYPYFAGDPIITDEDGTYADREAKLQNRVTCSWAHPVSEVVSALIDAGLRIEFLHEFPFTIEQFNEWLHLCDDGYWRLPRHAESFPLMYSIRATKPERPS
jgi:SAM-dependent methyltransferase